MNIEVLQSTTDNSRNFTFITQANQCIHIRAGDWKRALILYNDRYKSIDSSVWNTISDALPNDATTTLTETFNKLCRRRKNRLKYVIVRHHVYAPGPYGLANNTNPENSGGCWLIINAAGEPMVMAANKGSTPIELKETLSNYLTEINFKIGSGGWNLIATNISAKDGSWQHLIDAFNALCKRPADKIILIARLEKLSNDSEYSNEPDRIDHAFTTYIKNFEN